MIRHIVFFKFKPDISPAEREEAISSLRGLPDKIDFIRTFELGEDVLKLPRSWDLVLVATTILFFLAAAGYALACERL